MNWFDKLNELVGHEVSVPGGSGGILEEVGEDFLVIRPISYTPGHPEEMKSRSFIKLNQVTRIVHVHDCEKCELDSSVQSVA